jgi:flagellar protein FliO/FliZ
MQGMKPRLLLTSWWVGSLRLLGLALLAGLVAVQTGRAETQPAPEEQDSQEQLPASQESVPAQADPNAQVEETPDTQTPPAARLGREGTGQLGSLTGKSGDANDMLWRMLASVLIIAALGAAAYVGIRRLGPKFRLVPKRKIHMVETLPLGARKSLHLVEVDGKRLLLGASRENVAILTELSATDAEEADQSPSSQTPHTRRKPDTESKDTTQGSFQSALQEQMQ